MKRQLRESGARIAIDLARTRYDILAATITGAYKALTT
jgi:hypothetical protein